MSQTDMAKDIMHVVVLIGLIFILVFVMVWTNVIPCKTIPGFCDLYYGIKGGPRVAIVYGDEGMGNPELLQNVMSNPKIIGKRPDLLRLSSISLGNLQAYDLVIVEKAKVINTSKVEAFAKYSNFGGKIIFVGDAGSVVVEKEKGEASIKQESGLTTIYLDSVDYSDLVIPVDVSFKDLQNNSYDFSSTAFVQSNSVNEMILNVKLNQLNNELMEESVVVSVKANSFGTENYNNEDKEILINNYSKSIKINITDSIKLGEKLSFTVEATDLKGFNVVIKGKINIDFVDDEENQKRRFFVELENFSQGIDSSPESILYGLGEKSNEKNIMLNMMSVDFQNYYCSVKDCPIASAENSETCVGSIELLIRDHSLVKGLNPSLPLCITKESDLALNDLVGKNATAVASIDFKADLISNGRNYGRNLPLIITTGKSGFLGMNLGQNIAYYAVPPESFVKEIILDDGKIVYSGYLLEQMYYGMLYG